MPKQWTQKDIQAAFDAALVAATNSQKVRNELLDPKTTKTTLAREGDIDIPGDVEVVFVKQEELPLRVVMAMPAEIKPGGPPPLAATFRDCFLCTYDSYETVTPNAAKELEAVLKVLLSPST